MNYLREVFSVESITVHFLAFRQLKNRFFQINSQMYTLCSIEIKQISSYHNIFVKYNQRFST